MRNHAQGQDMNHTCNSSEPRGCGNIMPDHNGKMPAEIKRAGLRKRILAALLALAIIAASVALLLAELSGIIPAPPETPNVLTLLFSAIAALVVTTIVVDASAIAMVGKTFFSRPFFSRSNAMYLVLYVMIAALKIVTNLL